MPHDWESVMLYNAKTHDWRRFFTTGRLSGNDSFDNYNWYECSKCGLKNLGMVFCSYSCNERKMRRALE
jgi:hypothetical protein